MPAVLSRKASDWRTASSSSTMCTTKLSGIAASHIALQGKAEQSPALRICLSPHLSAMCFDDALGDGETDSHAGWLGGDERLKKSREDFLGKAVSRIDDPDLDHAMVQQGRFNHELLLRTPLHGFDRIADQVKENLLNLHLFYEDGARPLIEAEDRFNTLLLGAGTRAKALASSTSLLMLSGRLSVSPRATNSRKRRMIWPARSVWCVVSARAS